MVKGLNKLTHLKSQPVQWLLRLTRRLADTSLPEVLLIASLVLSRWWANSDFSYPAEIGLPLLLFAVLASLIFYFYRWVLGRGLAAHVAALTLIACLYNYKFITESSLGKLVINQVPDSISGELANSLILLALLAVICALVGRGLGKVVASSKTLKQLQLYRALLFTLLFVFAIQSLKGAQRFLAIHEQLSYHYPAPDLVRSGGTITAKPDIYYLVFDRYGSTETLKNIYNYDNSDLLNFLDSQGFINRTLAYANYPFTMSSVSSTMAMNYFPEFQKKFANSGDWQSAFPYRSILNNPPIAQILKKDGYQYNQVSSWWDFTRVGIAADSNPTRSFRLTLLGRHFYLSDLQRDIINKSVLSPWLKKGLSLSNFSLLKYDLNHNPQQNFESQVVALKKLAVRPDKSTPQFSFAHILVPHDPYIFTTDGSTPSYSGDRTDEGVAETVKYTNQLTYLNKRIKDLVANIRQQSPNAAIVIQADEGPYPSEFRFQLKPGHYYDPAKLAIPQMKQKFSILASYYMPGFDMQKLKEINASVNTFRFILNNYLGYSLPLLPDCHLSTGDKFTVYNYQLVNEKLTGVSAPKECGKYQ